MIGKACNEDEKQALCQILEDRLENHWDSLDCPRIQSEEQREATVEKLVEAINMVLDKADGADESKKLDQILNGIQS
jgi:hypothetical protein